MVRSQKGGTSARKSIRLEKKRGKVFIHDLPDTNLGSKIHSTSGSKEDLVVVTQEKRSSTSPSQIPDLEARSERSSTLDFIEEVLFGYEREEFLSDNKPTHLKYNRF